MPTIDDVHRILALTKSPDELDFFYDQLTSPDWIPALRQAGLFAEPPRPVQQSGGIAFPGWGLSRYLVRMAPRAPLLVADVLGDLEQTDNPRVQNDVVEALLGLPPDLAERLTPTVGRWIHHPYRLGLARPVAQLAESLLAAGLRAAGLELLASCAALIPPISWSETELWLPLEDYEYGQYLPGLARSAAAFGLEGGEILARELERYLAAEHPEDEGPSPRDYSLVWRPAIEDHEQNEDFDRHAKLLVGVRDAYVAAIERDQTLVAAAVGDLLGRSWAALKRVGLFLLSRYGHDNLDLVGAALTDDTLFGDVDVHHEFYRLASEYFQLAAPTIQARYLELVDEVAARATEDDPTEQGERRRLWWIRNRLGAIVDGLPNESRARYDAIALEYPAEPHPDFLTYHTSWTGPTSPKTEEDLSRFDEWELVDYLAQWQPEDEDWRPSQEGLARVLTAVVRARPEAYAAAAPRYIDLPPAYASGLLFGFREALQSGKSFDWTPLLSLCTSVVRRPVGADEVSPTGDRDGSWAWVRTAVAHLIDTGLEDRPGVMPIAERNAVWPVIAILAEDRDPTPEAEAQHAAGNVDPLTSSVNTTRGVGLHAVCGYVAWAWRSAGRPAEWRLTTHVPEAERVLVAHLDPAHDPSMAIRAVYGWWLAWLIAMDHEWVSRHVFELLGDLSAPHELTAWETYLVHSNADLASYDVLADRYERYASFLATLEELPDRRSSIDPADRFIQHLVRLRDRLPSVGGPIDEMLREGRPWLIETVVAASGRVIHNASEYSDEAAISLQALWLRISGVVTKRNDPAARQALAPFGWWFASSLPPYWTLPELISILAGGSGVDPQFLVLEKLATVGDSYPELSLRALESIVGREEQGWTLRTHEKDIRTVLTAALALEDEMLRARAEQLTHRLGRLGLQSLASLL